MVELGSSKCNQCGGEYVVARVVCAKCEASTDGQFALPRLARLSAEDRRFVELFVLADGSIKEIGKVLGVSYPTVRNRLDKVVSALRDEIARDAKNGKTAKGGK